MSYPPGPQNPYGQQPPLPPQQPQQPYGYPQQPPAPQPQPGYGYPQQPPSAQPYGAYPQQPQAPYGYPGGPGGPGGTDQMPSGPKGARIMLFVVGGLQILFALIAFAFAGILAAADETGAFSNYSGISWFVGIFEIALGAVCIAMGAKFKTGGPGTRTGAMVIGALVVVLSICNFLLAGLLSIFTLVLGVLVIVFSAKAETAAWFNRPRY